MQCNLSWIHPFSGESEIIVPFVGGRKPQRTFKRRQIWPWVSIVGIVVDTATWQALRPVLIGEKVNLFNKSIDYPMCPCVTFYLGYDCAMIPSALAVNINGADCPGGAYGFCGQRLNCANANAASATVCSKYRGRPKMTPLFVWEGGGLSFSADLPMQSAC